MLPLTLPKAPLCTVLYSVFMLCEAETTAGGDVFELAVAQSTAIYSVFEPAVKKHRNLRRVQRHGRQKHCYLRGFLHFCAKTSSLGNVQKHSTNMQKPMFLPNKSGENRHPNSSEITKSGPRPPDKTHEQHNYASQNQKSKTKSKKTVVFSLFYCRFWAGACTN